MIVGALVGIARAAGLATTAALLGFGPAAAPALGRALFEIALANLLAPSGLLVMALFGRLAPRAVLLGIALAAESAGSAALLLGIAAAALTPIAALSGLAFIAAPTFWLAGMAAFEFGVSADAAHMPTQPKIAIAET